MTITAKELYNRLLDIKNNQPEHKFNGLDLLPFGNVDMQMEQLVYEGKIIKHTDILDSFEVVS
ncbi:MAG: hypothetical protein ACI4RM_04950 [Ruminococcus sp.]